MFRLTTSALLPLFAAALVACDAADTYPITGRVLEVNGQVLTLEHDEIPGFMAAMTMPLPADAPAFGEYQPGSVISGTLRVSDDGMKVVEVRITGHEQLNVLGTSADPEVGSVLPAVTLPTLAGDVMVGQGQGVPTVLTFLFTQCPVEEYCPLLASKLARLQPLIQGRARIVAVTLDPERDSLEVLKAYGEGYGADPAVWRFARLDLESLDGLLRLVGGQRVPENGSISHNLRLLALDADGRILALHPDNEWDPEAVAALFPAE